MTRRITFSDRAVTDLIAIEAWIAEQAGWDIAIAYTDRVRAKVATLLNFPLRGTPRDDLVPGLRTINFERKLIIGYRVTGDEVSVEAVVSAARGEASWH